MSIRISVEKTYASYTGDEYLVVELQEEHIIQIYNEMVKLGLLEEKKE